MSTAARELQAYLARQLIEHADEIAPELVDYVGGNSKEEIDASIAKVKATSAQLEAHVSGWTQDVVREGVSTSAEAGLAARIAAMSTAEFGAYRAQLGLK